MNNEIIIVNNEDTSPISGEIAHLDVYHEVYKLLNKTGKEISKSYDDNLKITMEDIEELHCKIIQSIESQNGEGIILKINIEQLKGENYIFNDFSDFKKNNRTGPNPTQEIILDYKYIIKNKELKSFEKYKVVLRLASRATQLYDARKNTPDIMLEFLSNFRSTVARIDIEYYDYVKARSILATFDEWVKGCNKTSSPKFLNEVKWFFNKCNWLIKIFVLFLFTIGTYNQVNEEINNSSYIIKFIVIYLFVFYFLIKTTNNIAMVIRKSINSYFLMSYISVNKGDTNLIRKYTAYNKNNIYKSIVGILLTLIIGITSAYCYDIIKVLFLN